MGSIRDGGSASARRRGVGAPESTTGRTTLLLPLEVAFAATSTVDAATANAGSAGAGAVIRVSVEGADIIAVVVAGIRLRADADLKRNNASNAAPACGPGIYVRRP